VRGVCTVAIARAVAIGRLERWFGTSRSRGWSNPYIERNAFRVASSAPGRGHAARDMAKAGCEVTVYEAFHEAGRAEVRHSDFRLPNTWWTRRSASSSSSACASSATTLVGRLFTIEQMIGDGFHAVFIGTGRATELMGIPGSR